MQCAALAQQPHVRLRALLSCCLEGDHIRVKSVVFLIMNVSPFLINSLLNVRSLS